MLPVLEVEPGVTPELANCRRVLRVVRSLSAAGGQTEFPNGCGRLALRAYEEKPWRAGGHCRCPRRMAGDLLSDGRSRFDNHDRDYAVSPLAAGQRCAAQPSIMHAAEGWMLPVLDLNSAIGSTGHGNPLAMLRYQALQTHRQA